MKFDLHCHTKEGSLDARVDISTYMNTLMDKGINGMLVTDHNSFKGYYAGIKSVPENFVLLKGIEYDTRNGGHIIVILPDHADPLLSSLLEIRGMSVAALERLVHMLGGILGPAHPYDTGYYAYMNTHFAKKHPEFIKRFDFIESFNSCAKQEANVSARYLAEELGMPETAGSDTHRPEVIGSAFTEFEQQITCNDDLISAILSTEKSPIVSHDLMRNMRMNKGFFVEKFLVGSYWVYNRLLLVKRLKARTSY